MISSSAFIHEDDIRRMTCNCDRYFFLKQVSSSSVKVDSVTGDAAEVTFVEYGNSAVCALGQLQPWDALIGEDGQLMKK